jgi:hypothetical protein
MPIGWQNPLPFRIGGKTRTKTIHQDLRAAYGENGPGPEGGLDDLWLRAEARAMARARDSLLRAYAQSWPQRAPFPRGWEDLLAIRALDTLDERQQACALALTGQALAACPDMLEALQRIDPGFTIEEIPYEQVGLVQFGRDFGFLPGVPGFAYSTGVWAARKSSAWPGYSDVFVLYVRWSGAGTEIPAASITAAERYLAEVLPTYMDWSLYNLSEGPEGYGFYLDGGEDGTSLLDQTAFG